MVHRSDLPLDGLAVARFVSAMGRMGHGEVQEGPILSVPQSEIRNPKSLMPAFLFWIFALLMLGFGAAVVINRNPIASALSLVICFIGLSALFMSLDAFFIGIIQILVYAGAVMVLFLFIIMLLDLRAEARRKLNWVALVGGCAVALAFFIQVYLVVGQLGAAKQPFPPLGSSKVDDVHHVGLLLFSNYTLPFQIIGVLILVATIGVIVLSKRELK